MRSNSMRVYLTTLPLAFVLVSGCWRRTQLAATWHEPSPTLLNFNRTVSVFATTNAIIVASETHPATTFAMAMPNAP